MALRHLFGTSARSWTIAGGELGPPRLCSAGFAHLPVMNLHDPTSPSEPRIDDRVCAGHHRAGLLGHLLPAPPRRRPRPDRHRNRLPGPARPAPAARHCRPPTRPSPHHRGAPPDVTPIDRSTAKGARDAALIPLGFASALRVSELSALTQADLEPTVRRAAARYPPLQDRPRSPRGDRRRRPRPASGHRPDLRARPLAPGPQHDNWAGGVVARGVAAGVHQPAQRRRRHHGNPWDRHLAHAPTTCSGRRTGGPPHHRLTSSCGQVGVRPLRSRVWIARLRARTWRLSSLIVGPRGSEYGARRARSRNISVSA